MLSRAVLVCAGSAHSMQCAVTVCMRIMWHAVVCKGVQWRAVQCLCVCYMLHLAAGRGSSRGCQGGGRLETRVLRAA